MPTHYLYVIRIFPFGVNLFSKFGMLELDKLINGLKDEEFEEDELEINMGDTFLVLRRHPFTSLEALHSAYNAGHWATLMATDVYIKI